MSRHNRVNFLFIIGGFLGIVLALSAVSPLFPGQVKPKTDDQQAVRLPKPLEHEVSVVLKLIQVYVTDGKGKPVLDLTKNDFVVRDNGRPMTVTDFERHALAAGAPAKPAPAAIPTNPAEPPPGAAPASSAPAPSISRKFFLFFDFAFTNQQGARKAKDAAQHFLDKEVKPGDEVGLMTYSLTRGLSIHEFLTTDLAKVRQALAGVAVGEVAGRGDDIEQQYYRALSESIIGSDLTNRTPGYNSDLGWKRQESKNQALNFILKLTYLAKGLRYVPGQKNLMLFSSGIPSSMIYGNQNVALETGDHVLRTKYEEMLKELSGSNCSFFTFDVREAAMVPSLFDSDDQTFSHDRNTGRSRFTNRGVQNNYDTLFKDDNATGLYSLRRLAKTTGGKYFSNLNEYEQNLADLQSLTSSYYVIGYPVSQEWNGEFHELKIEVARKGCEVRTQAGYFNPKPFGEYTDLEKQLHLLDLATSENPLFQIPAAGTLLALAGEGGGGSPNLVLLMRLPAEVQDRWSGGKAEIVTFLFDQRDNLVDLRKTEDSLSRHKGRAVFHATGLTVAPGSYKAKVVVRDLETGTAAVASASIEVPAIPTPGIRLHPALLLIGAEREAYLEARSKDAATAPAAGAEAASFAWSALYPFDAKMQAPLLGPIPVGTESVDVVLPCAISGIANARIALKIALTDSGTGVMIPVKIAHKGQIVKGSTVINIFEVPTKDLRSGNYILSFEAQEPTTRAVANAKVKFIVR